MDKYIVHTTLEPRVLMNYVARIDRALVEKIWKQSSGMAVEAVADGFVQIFQDKRILQKRIESIRTEAQKIANNPQIADQLKSAIGTSELSIPFPENGATLHFISGNMITKKSGFLKELLESYRPLASVFELAYDELSDEGMIHFPSLQSLKIYLYLFTKSYIQD